MQNLNSCFALALFNVSDDRSINSRNVFSFKVAGQIYNQINIATHSSQIPEGNLPFRPDKAVEERVTYPLNSHFNRKCKPRIITDVDNINFDYCLLWRR